MLLSAQPATKTFERENCFVILGSGGLFDDPKVPRSPGSQSGSLIHKSPCRPGGYLDERTTLCAVEIDNDNGNDDGDDNDDDDDDSGSRLE